MRGHVEATSSFSSFFSATGSHDNDDDIDSKHYRQYDDTGSDGDDDHSVHHPSSVLVDTVALTVDQVLADSLPTVVQPHQPKQNKLLRKQPQPPTADSLSLSRSSSSSSGFNRHNRRVQTLSSSALLSSALPHVPNARSDHNAGGNGDTEKNVEETPVQEARRMLVSKVGVTPAALASTDSTTAINATTVRAHSKPPGESAPRNRFTTTTTTTPRTTTTASRLAQPATGSMTSTTKSRTSLPQPTKSRMPATKTYSRLATTTILPQGRPLPTEQSQRPQGKTDEVAGQDEEDSIEYERKEEYGEDQQQQDEEEEYERPIPDECNNDGECKVSPRYNDDDSVEGSIASRTRSSRSRQQQQQQQRSQNHQNNKLTTPTSGLTPPRKHKPPETSLRKPVSTTRVSRVVQPPKSNRTGKSLSAIPSDRRLPMSPLVDFIPSTNNKNNTCSRQNSTDDEEDDENDNEENESSTPTTTTVPKTKNGAVRSTIAATPNRRRVELQSTSSGSLNSSRSNTNHLRRQSSSSLSQQQQQQQQERSHDNKDDHPHSDYDLSDSDRSDRSAKRTSAGVGTTSSHKNNRRPVHGMQQQAIRKDEGRRKTVAVAAEYRQNQPSRRDTFNPKSWDNGMHNSFQAQIEDLRDENDDAHEEEILLMRPFGEQGVEEGNSEEDDDDEEDMRIRVVVRKRPLSTAEQASKMGGKNVDVIHPLDYGRYGRILVYQPKTRVDLTKEIETVPFAFDNVFDEVSNNTQIYERTVRPLIPPLFEGQWGCVFAYGQTGSGKTFTM